MYTAVVERGCQLPLARGVLSHVTKTERGHLLLLNKYNISFRLEFLHCYNTLHPRWATAAPTDTTAVRLFKCVLNPQALQFIGALRRPFIFLKDVSVFVSLKQDEGLEQIINNYCCSDKQPCLSDLFFYY